MSAQELAAEMVDRQGSLDAALAMSEGAATGGKEGRQPPVSQGQLFVPWAAYGKAASASRALGDRTGRSSSESSTTSNWRTSGG